MKTTRLLFVLSLFILAQFSLLAESSITIHCPDDVWLDCDDEIWNLSIYGNASYTDYNGSHSAGTPTVEYYLNSCNTGHITRTWTVEDDNWNQVSCTQHIYVFADNFSASNIHWPKPEVVLEGCNPNTDPLSFDPEYGPPSYDYKHCSHIGISHKDQTFTFGPDCKKILRTWTLIDWCTYHPQMNPYKGKWSFQQTIKISASTAPTLECLDDITVSSFNCQGAAVTLNTLEIDNSTCGGSYVIEHDSPYADTTGANASGIYPIGITEIKYRIVYGCGQVHYCKQNINVIDDKRPGAYCYGGLSVSLMGVDTDNDGVFDDGMVEIWAKDLDRGSFPACHKTDLYYSFSPDIDSTSRVFTCADVGKNMVRMYVTDHFGHQSYCIVDIDIQNNGANIPNCEPTSTKVEPKQNVFGTIETYRGDRLEKSYVDLRSMEMETILVENDEDPTMVYTEEILDSFYNSSGIVVYNKIVDSILVMQYDTFYQYRFLQTMSDQEGNYTLEDVGMNFEYKVEPRRIFAQDNEVNIYDVQAIFNHVVARKVITDPYRLIAGDINFDQKIDMEDVDLLLAYIKGNKIIIDNEDRWKFIDKSFEFDLSSDILSQEYPEFIIIDKNEELTDDQGFIAVRLGDLDERIKDNSNSYSRSFVMDNIESEIRSYKGESSIQIEFAPNPFTDFTKFSINGSFEGQYSLLLYNSNGQLIFERTSDEKEFIINEVYESGVYIYRMVVENQLLEGRIVKI